MALAVSSGTGTRPAQKDAEVEQRCVVLRREIEEREVFLSQLTEIGFEDKYEATVLDEIAQRKREMARLRREYKPSKLTKLSDFEYNANGRVAQYGDDLFRCHVTQDKFDQFGHLAAHRRLLARRAEDEAEQQRIRDAVPHGRETSYEVYGDRFGVHATRLEEARATQAAVTAKFKEEQARRAMMLGTEIGRQQLFRDVQASRDSENRRERRSSDAVAAAEVAEERRQLVEQAALNAELHERIEMQDTRAQLWEQEKQQAAKARAAQEAEVEAKRMSAEATELRRRAVEREAALAAQRAENEARRQVMERQNWEDELSDLRRSVKTLSDGYDRRAAQAAELARAADEAARREAAERMRMAAEEARQRQIEEALRRQRPPPQRRKRQRRRKGHYDAGDYEAELARRLAEEEARRRRELEQMVRECVQRAIDRTNRCRFMEVREAFDQWVKVRQFEWLRAKMIALQGAAEVDGKAKAWRTWCDAVVAAREWVRMQEEARLRRLAQRQNAYMASFRNACDESDMAHVINFRWGPATGFIDTASGAHARSAKAQAQRQKNKLKQKKTVKGPNASARARTLGAFSSSPVCR